MAASTFGLGQIPATTTTLIMTDSDIYWTFATAVQYGGSFYKALASAGMKGDSSNKRRLLVAFPELTATYGTASKLHRTLREGITA